MGVLAPGSAHAWPSAQPPIDTSGNFPEHVFVWEVKNLAISGDSKHYSCFQNLS